MRNQIFSKLEITERELQNFNKLKNNYYISDKLFIKNNKTYSIKIEYNENCLSHLFNDNIKIDDLVFTLKESNKILVNKGTKKQVINKLESILKDNNK